MLYQQAKRIQLPFSTRLATLLFFGFVSSLIISPFLQFSSRMPAMPTPPTRPSVPNKTLSTITNTPTPRATPVTPTLKPTTKKLLFGVGSEADGAIQARITKESPVGMLTSWYNGHNDLSWMTGWKGTLVPELYQKGYTLHLITYTDYPEMTFQTKYGPACGREYPLTPQFLTDMRQLAETFKGDGRLYVTLFTEFQTYPCTDNTWKGNEAYYQTLQDQFRAARTIFKEVSPNAQVALSWGGWQSRWDDESNGGGRSLIPHFAETMKASDFTAFQAMQSDTNSEDIKQMTKLLASYKKPVMLSHYKPDNSSQSTFNADMQALFTDSTIQSLQSQGLFAISFMDTVNMQDETAYQTVKAGITKYGVIKP